MRQYFENKLLRTTENVLERTELTALVRQTYWALMVRNSASLMADITAIYMEEVEIVKNATGILPSVIYQPITTAMTSHFSKNGGNALGFGAADGPLNRTSPFFLPSLSQTNNPSNQRRFLLVPRQR